MRKCLTGGWYLDLCGIGLVQMCNCSRAKIEQASNTHIWDLGFGIWVRLIGQRHKVI